MPKKGSTTVPVGEGEGSSTGKQPKAKATSKASKAGILFPVPKINKRMQKSGWTDRVGGTAPVWVAAVTDYLAREVVEAAAKVCHDNGKHKRLQPRDVLLAVRNDSDLNRVFAGIKVLVGDKLKGVADEVVCDADKRYNDKLKADAKAAATAEA